MDIEFDVEMSLLCEAAYHSPNALTPLQWQIHRDFLDYQRRLRIEQAKDRYNCELPPFAKNWEFFGGTI